MRWSRARLGDLGPGLVLAPERRLVGAPGRGPTLGDVAEIASDRVTPDEIAREGLLVLDTTHLKDGLLDVRSAAREGGVPSSAKRRLAPGDLVVSRLRPYLRQVALVHPRAIALAGGRGLAGSAELYVLRPRAPRRSLAWLLPWLLSDAVQAALAAGQEGGHHPRVAVDTVLGLPLGAAARPAPGASAAIERAIARVYDALADLERLAPVAPVKVGSRAPGHGRSTARHR